MISAQEARLTTTNNFESNLTDKQFSLHSQINKWIEQAVAHGFYNIDKNYKDFGENWIDEYKKASIVRLIPYYQELGYEVFVTYTSGLESLIIRW